MKRTKIFIALAVMTLGVSLVSCEQEEVNQLPVHSEELQTYSAKSEDGYEEVYFDDVYQFLDYYDALCTSGEAYTLIPYSNGIAISETVDY